MNKTYNVALRPAKTQISLGITKLTQADHDKQWSCLSRPSNPLMTNGVLHLYHLDESTIMLRGIRSSFSFLFYFSMKIM